MKSCSRTMNWALVSWLLLAGVTQASEDVQMHWSTSWQKMSAKIAKTKAVEAMVLKNDFIHAATQGNLVFGHNETARAVVEAIPVRDGVQLTIVVAGADTKEAARLGNAIRAHIVQGPYDADIPATLDSKTAGRKSTAPGMHVGGGTRDMSELLFQAAARSSLVQHGLKPSISPGGTTVTGFKKESVVAAFFTPLPTGKAHLTVVAASSEAGRAEELRNAVRADVFAGKIPAVFDLCEHQSPIRNQGQRGSCTYFGPTAALEAAYRRQGTPVDLSVQHLIWLRDGTTLFEEPAKTSDTAENLIGSLTGGGLRRNFQILNTYNICRAEDMPYIGASEYENYSGKYFKGFGLEKYAWDKPFSQFLVNRWNVDPKQFPQAARLQAKYGIQKSVLLPEKDLKSVAKFEQILASGREIVWTVQLHDDIHHVDPADLVWRRQPGSKSWPSDGNSHVTMIVGYDSVRKFFIVKNSWGATSYTRQKDKLAAGWKDIVKYDGYTLVDYNYIGDCIEAGYIVETTDVNGPRSVGQRAMGQWDVTFTDKSKNQPLMTGVLVWRRMPNTAGLPKPDLRIGDLVTKDGKQFRVNAKLSGLDATLYINFAGGALAYDAASGTAWKGKLVLPKDGEGSMSMTPQGGSPPVWGVSAQQVQMTAVQVSDRNLLKGLPVPR